MKGERVLENALGVSCVAFLEEFMTCMSSSSRFCHDGQKIEVGFGNILYSRGGASSSRLIIITILEFDDFIYSVNGHYIRVKSEQK